MSKAFPHGKAARHGNAQDQQKQIILGRLPFADKNVLEESQKLVDKGGDENQTIHAALLGCVVCNLLLAQE